MINNSGLIFLLVTSEVLNFGKNIFKLANVVLYFLGARRELKASIILKYYLVNCSNSEFFMNCTVTNK